MGKESPINKSANYTKLKIGLIVFILLLIVFLVQMYQRAYRDNGIDFTSYLLSSKALLKGTNPYETGSPFQYIYPLFLTFILIPLTELPYWFSLILWYITGVLSFYYSVFFTLKIYKKGDLDLTLFLGLPFFLLVIILSNVIQNNLLNGQVNFIVFILSILFFYFYLEKKTLLASFCLAVAISIKIVPALFLILVFRKERLPVLWYTLLFVIILCVVLPGTIQGLKIFDYYKEYVNKFVIAGINETPSALNDHSFFFTLYGFVIYLFPVLIKIKLLKIIFSAIAIIAVITINYKSPIEKHGKNAPFIMSLLFLSILLIGPMSETHHLIYILPALCLVLYDFLINKVKMNKRTIIISIMFVVTFSIGNFFKTGVYYFISIVCLYILMTDRISWRIKIA